MTDSPDTPIARKIAEVDAACSCKADAGGCRFAGRKPLTCRCQSGSFRCCWELHRLARELAKVSQERMRLRGNQVCCGNTGRGLAPPDCSCFDTGDMSTCHRAIARTIAALPLEGVNDPDR